MNRFYVFAPVLAVLMTASVAIAADAASYVNPKTLDLLTLLPPPPAADSSTTKDEIAEIHAFEKSRTPEREKIAQDDQTETVFAVVRDTLGSSFTEQRLPVTAAFFKKVLGDEGVIVDPAKDVWARKRPAAIDPTVKLCVKASGSASYPSGHATVAYLTAIVLSDLLPQSRGTLFADAARFAESRVVCGIHYRSDVIASRTAAAVIAQQMRANPVFQKDFAAAQAELRAAHIAP